MTDKRRKYHIFTRSSQARLRLLFLPVFVGGASGVPPVRGLVGAAIGGLLLERDRLRLTSTSGVNHPLKQRLRP